VTELPFAKYHAAGNDFILIEDLDDAVALRADEVMALCDRWCGIGADGVIRVTRGGDVPFAFHLVNADGSPAEVSGNGLRCLGAFVHDRTLSADDTFDVMTSAGIRQVSLTVAEGVATGATVAMGLPGFTKAQIPMRGPAWETFMVQPFDLGGGLTVTASALSMGNPHLVLFLADDPERFHVEHIGPALEHHEWFPERTNVEFAWVRDDAIEARVWERGVGETLSCGTGACAVAVAANEAGLAPRRAIVRFRGGSLKVERAEDGQVLLGGPVTHVFDGVVDPQAL
jgi:diaminopimelate epimerase